MEVSSGMVSHISKSLDNNLLSIESLSHADLFDKGGSIEEFFGAEEDPQPSGLSSSFNSSLRDKLTGAAPLVVEVSLSIHVLVGVLDPSHGLLVGAHVRSETVDSWPDESLLGQLHGVLPGDSLHFALGVIPWVESNSTLGSAEWDLAHIQLESHEGSQGHDLLDVDVVGVPGSSLHGQEVVLVLCSVGSDHLQLAVVSPQRELKSHHGVATHDIVKQVLGQPSFLRSPVVEKLHVFEEPGFLVSGGVVLHGMESCSGH